MKLIAMDAGKINTLECLTFQISEPHAIEL